MIGSGTTFPQSCCTTWWSTVSAGDAGEVAGSVVTDEIALVTAPPEAAAPNTNKLRRINVRRLLFIGMLRVVQVELPEGIIVLFSSGEYRIVNAEAPKGPSLRLRRWKSDYYDAEII